MTPEDPSPPKRFEDRLRAAQESRSARAGTDTGAARSGALGIGFRIGTELVAAILVGVGIGWLLDRWLGTKPWLLLLFLLLGGSAGILNVVRAAGRMKFGDSGKDVPPGDRPGGE